MQQQRPEHARGVSPNVLVQVNIYQKNHEGRWLPMNINGWRVRVPNKRQGKDKALRSIVDSTSASGIYTYSNSLEISIKGPDKKNTIVFVNWQEELYLSELFEDFGFSSTKQGSATLYSAALFYLGGPRDGPRARKVRQARGASIPSEASQETFPEI